MVVQRGENRRRRRRRVRESEGKKGREMVKWERERGGGQMTGKEGVRKREQGRVGWAVEIGV